MNQKFFFMHIAKAAGSYVNNSFIDFCGEENSLTHIERFSAEKIANCMPNNIFVSGHYYWKDWNCIDQKKIFLPITFIRSPIEHIASHIQWLDHYNIEGYRREYNMLDSDTKNIIDQIGRIDVNDVGDLDYFLTHLSGKGVQLLDNCQSRYFLAGGKSNKIRKDSPLSLNLRKELKKESKNFIYIGTVESMDSAISSINKILGIDISCAENIINPSLSNRKINISKPLVRKVLEKRILLDVWFYDSIVSGLFKNSS